MGWQVWGRPYESGELSNTNLFVRIRPNSNILLKYVRTWVIFYNDPTLTSLTMKMYSDNSDKEPGVLLYNSLTTHTKAEMITLSNGIKELYFEFNETPMQQNTFYHFVLSGSGYVPTSNSHLAWMQGFPDPVLTVIDRSTEAEKTIYGNSVNAMPYAAYLIGAEY